MKKYFLVLFICLLWIGSANALSLCWDQVTTDTSGVPLGAGMQVTQYKVWKCNTPSSSCLKSSASVIGTVSTPFPALPAKACMSITTQPIPSTFFVTAVNVVTESVESDSLKATGADKPKNLDFVNP